MNDLKTLNDKRNDHRLTQAERDEAQKQWDAIHAEFELLKAEDERNYVSFGEVEGWKA